jgi:oxaloacetate decarboxylase alpha subunit
VISCRPADTLEPELEKLQERLLQIAQEKNIRLAERLIDDVLIFALFADAGLQFLEKRASSIQ